MLRTGCRATFSPAITGSRWDHTDTVVSNPPVQKSHLASDCSRHQTFACHGTCKQQSEAEISSRVIWQYWETVGNDKPAFVDGLYAIAKKNAGAEIVRVTPETLRQFLPDIPSNISNIAQIAHKADMIRAMLVMRHGGMWLDSDAIVLRRLDWILDLLDTYDFVCFNDGGLLEQARPWVRVNCFASRANGQVVSEWVRRQHAKFPRTQYDWEEIGTELLHPICLENKQRVKTLPFEAIAPVRYNQTLQFTSREIDASTILRDCYVVMLSNHSLKETVASLRRLTTEQIASGDYLLSAIMRHAMNVAGLPYVARLTQP